MNMPSGSVTLYLFGGEELADDLTAMGRAAGKAARGALRIAAAPMEAAVRSRIHSVTGLLAATTRVRMGGVSKDQPGRYSVWIGATATKRQLERRRPRTASEFYSRKTPGTKWRVYYAWMVEKGHGGPHPAPKHEFAGPGFDATVDQVATEAERLLWENVEQAG